MIIFILMRSKKGIWNALTAFILVIAAVIITFAVIFYAFSIMYNVPLHQVYYTGKGSIGLGQNGIIIVNVTIESHSIFKIVNATLDGNIFATKISPNTLTYGENNVTIYFPAGSIKLAPDTSYTILIVVNNGEKVLAVVYYQ